MLLRAKKRLDTRISVCIPAHNEESTVGLVVTSIVRDLVVKHPLVEEVVVLDDRSTDRTAAVAAAAGARVVRVADVLPGVGSPPGKGNAMWRSLHASDGEIVCWIDADIRGFSSAIISGTVGPLLTVTDVSFVKGFYARRTCDGGGGGRVTELVAKPLIASLFPLLVGVHQPLAGATAARRDVLESLPFPAGWGVELALLLDVAKNFGIDAIAQTDLGELHHRNKPLEKLIPQATAVIDVALARSGIAGGALTQLLARKGLDTAPQRMVELPPARAFGLEKTAWARELRTSVVGG